jgi:flagellar protein FliS
MLPANPWKSYRQVAAQTATPGQLILMLYEGALRDLGRALLGFDLHDPAERNETINNNILKAQQILHGLTASLDMNKGGELARHLQRLYDYMNRRLFESNLKKRQDGIHEVIRHLAVLRDAWAKMLQGEAVDANEPEPQAPLRAA